LFLSVTVVEKNRSSPEKVVNLVICTSDASVREGSEEERGMKQAPECEDTGV